MTIDTKTAVYKDIIPGACRLYIMFGGIVGGMGMPPFEFMRTGRLLPHSKVFIRDPYQAWYQRGLPGIGTSCTDVAEYLSGLIKASDAREVVFVGNSMGGFAALLFCGLLECGRAIAFSPQTFISAERRKATGDNRWAAQVERTHLHQGGVGSVYDIGHLLTEKNCGLDADIYVSRHDRLDVVHARALAGFAGVSVYEFDEGGHQLVAHLRDAGMLARILDGQVQ
jgi:pimeloyl-ACP methyl ester carboxylesterase